MTSPLLLRHALLWLAACTTCSPLIGCSRLRFLLTSHALTPSVVVLARYLFVSLHTVNKQTSCRRNTHLFSFYLLFLGSCRCGKPSSGRTDMAQCSERDADVSSAVNGERRTGRKVAVITGITGQVTSTEHTWAAAAHGSPAGIAHSFTSLWWFKLTGGLFTLKNTKISLLNLILP